MQYKTKIQSARRKYLQRSPLSDKEQKLIDKDLLGKDFLFFTNDDSSFIIPDKYNAATTYDLIENRINRNTASTRSSITRYISYAAAILILALLSTVAYNYLKQPEILQVTTSYGERKEVALPDGSTVVLNSMSSIAFPEKMSGKTRSVTLHGEAFFSVAKNPDKTFIVKAGDAEVKVLGTKFNVEAYESESSVTTTLFEGSVSVGISGSKPKILKPNEQAIINKETGKLDVKSLDNPETERAWRENILIFENQKLSDILNVLSREYNVIFEVEELALSKLRITARFDSKESIGKVLEVLSQSADFDYVQQSNTYKIATKR